MVGIAVARPRGLARDWHVARTRAALIYLATGRASCLVLALAALFLAGISFRYAKGAEG